MAQIIVPKSFDDWLKKAKRLGVENKTIYGLRTYDSASKLPEAQYLALRSIWVPLSASTLISQAMEMSDVEKAHKWLNKRADWKKYLEDLESPRKPVVTVGELGSFSFPCFARRQISGVREVDQEDKIDFTPMARRLRSSNRPPIIPESPSAQAARRKQGKAQTNPETPPGQSPSVDKTMNELFNLNLSDDDASSDSEAFPEWQMPAGIAHKFFPNVEDEQIVNYFLIAFLSTLTFHINGMQLEWSPLRKAFNFGNKDDTLFQARTDGHLFLTTSQAEKAKSKVIVEVKPTYRLTNTKIGYQATAQMAAWIFAEPDEEQASPSHRFRRAMILQERHQIRIVIAEYDANYVKYLRNTPNAPFSLMKMREYGLWDILNPKHMANLGPIIIALTRGSGGLVSSG